ncbi:MAG: type II toxin-antitoxin system ParD family antitoxin [Rhizobiaceae bacterium]
MTRNPSVSLTTHQQEFIAELVNSGRYQGVSDVVRAALRLLEEQEERSRAFIARLEAAAEEGLASGPAAPMEDLDSLIGEFKARRAARK